MVHNVRAMADHNQRRVARALARNDAHITFGPTLDPPFGVDDMVAEEIRGRERRGATGGEPSAVHPHRGGAARRAAGQIWR